MADTIEKRQYPLPSKIIQKNVDMLLERERLGLRKYGHTLDRRDLSHKDYLQHGLEEALDLSNYLQASIQRIDYAERAHSDLLERVNRIIQEERLNGVRSSTDVTKRLLQELGDHTFRFPPP